MTLQLDDTKFKTVIDNPRKRGIPGFGAWLHLLMERGLAIERKELSLEGEWKDTIAPLESRPPMKIDKKGRDSEPSSIARFDGSKVTILCAGCATECKRWELSAITIGGLVQFKFETADGDTLTRGWRVQPVTKKGLGCKVCAGRYLSEVTKVAGENEATSKYATTLAEMTILKATILDQYGPTKKVALDRSRCIHGLPSYACTACRVGKPKRQATIATKLPSARIAFLNVFEKES